MKIAYAALLFAGCAALEEIKASEMMVLYSGGQDDWEDTTHGIAFGLGQVGALSLADKFPIERKEMFLESGADNLFPTAADQTYMMTVVKPITVGLAPTVMISMGDNAATRTAEMAADATSLKWNVQCMRSSCPATSPIAGMHVTCVSPQVRGSDLVAIGAEMGGLHLISDGSAEATAMQALIQAEVDGGATLTFTTASASTEAEFQAAVTAAQAAAAALLIPSVSGFGASEADLATYLLANNAKGEIVPPSMWSRGLLAAYAPDVRKLAAACGRVVGAAGVLPETAGYESVTDHSYALHWNPTRATALGKTWTAQHKYATKVPRVQPAKKLLLLHAYGFDNLFTNQEDAGFVDTLAAANFIWAVDHPGRNIEMHWLYWWSKQYFTSAAMKQLIGDWNLEYTKRWQPDVVYTTDDNVVQYYSNPCFQQIEGGPAPICTTAGTQVVSTGINRDPHVSYAKICTVVQDDPTAWRNLGACAATGVPLYVAPGTANMDACAANEASCQKLYTGTRPVPLTIVLERPDTLTELNFFKAVKPTATKVVYITENNPTGSATADGMAAFMASCTNCPLSLDAANDLHKIEIGDQDSFWAVLASYQDKPEYVAYIRLSQMIFEAGVVEKILATNTLGETIYGPYMKAGTRFADCLHGGGASAYGMGRDSAEYVARILLLGESAADLELKNGPPLKLYNTGRINQLLGHGYQKIPADLMAAADGILQMCPPGSYQNPADFSCVPCAAGFEKLAWGNDALDCKRIACTPGSAFSIADSACAPCPAGTESVSGLECAPCPAGEVSAAPGSAKCDLCPAGSAQPLTGKATCDVCSPGFVAPERGALSCTQCPPGTGAVTNDAGIEECRPCPKGHYEKDRVCTACNSGAVQGTPLTTAGAGAVGAQSCICNEGMYFHPGKQSCFECPRHAFCPEGRGIPYVEEGFFGRALVTAGSAGAEVACADADFEDCTDAFTGMDYAPFDASFTSGMEPPANYETLAIWKCVKSKTCPKEDIMFPAGTDVSKFFSGVRSVGACSDGLGAELSTKNVPCTSCDQGRYLDTDTGACVGCTNQAALLPLLVIVVLLLLGCAHALSTAPKTQKLTAIVLLATSMGLLINMIQSLAVVSSFLINLPEWVSAILNFCRIFLFDIDVLRADCMIGVELGPQYFTQTLVPVLPLVIFLGISFVPKQKERAYNTIGMFYSIAYIFLCRTTFKVFECADIHPNAPPTIAEFPNVYCNEEQARGTVGWGVFCIFVYPVGIMTVCATLCYKAPAYYHNETFRKSTLFLLVRWLPTTWWFSLPFMLRNLLVAAAMMVYPTDGNMQLAWTGTVQTLYLYLLCMFLPYRGQNLSYADATLTMSLLFICLFGLAMGQVSTLDDIDDRISKYGFYFIATVVSAVSIPLFALAQMVTGLSLRCTEDKSAMTVVEDLMAVSEAVQSSGLSPAELAEAVDALIPLKEQTSLGQALNVVSREVFGHTVGGKKNRLFMAPAKAGGEKPAAAPAPAAAAAPVAEQPPAAEKEELSV